VALKTGLEVVYKEKPIVLTGVLNIAYCNNWLFFVAQTYYFTFRVWWYKHSVSGTQ